MVLPTYDSYGLQYQTVNQDVPLVQQWYNCYKVTNCFLIGLKALYTRGISGWYCKPVFVVVCLFFKEKIPKAWQRMP